MKVKTLSALAGAASVLACGSAQAAITMGVTGYQQGLDPNAPNYSANPFLQANGLATAIIQLQNIAPGETIQGFIGTPQNPWTISTSGEGFWNLAGQFLDGNGNLTFDGATSYYAATNASAPGGIGNIFDSGFLGSQATFGEPTGNPGTNPGGFALSGDGSSDVSIAPAAWLSLNPLGIDPPAATYNFLRITWAAEHSATVALVLAQNTPPLDFAFSVFIPGVPAPGALALLGLAGLVGTRRRRN